MKINELPDKNEKQSLMDYIEILTDLYLSVTKSNYRKKRGQFFTPEEVSKFMISQFERLDKISNIRILDPGSGIGIFETSICERILSNNTKTNVHFDLYENDKEIIPLLKRNMEACKEILTKKGHNLSYKIYSSDFISSKSAIFNEEVIFDSDSEGYDFIICNPPYYKLRKDSEQAAKMKKIIKGQPNIYTLFMALCAKLLKKNGQLTIITPRSYCSGLYFKEFRKWFFNNVNPIKIHVFKSRSKVFKKYDVLQEMIILTASKTLKHPGKISISESDGLTLKKLLNSRITNYNKVIIQKENDIVMRIPTTRNDERIAEKIDLLGSKLTDMNFSVSTGPVVPFRKTDYLLKKVNNTKFYPLIWMENIVNGKVEWPGKIRNDKPIALKRKEGCKKVTLPKGNYILIKRFSTKEGKRRIYAAVLSGNLKKYNRIGFENHINYIQKNNGKMTIDEAYGIMSLLNSEIYDRYFQITNGCTQVNASEIENIPLPQLITIKKIGALARKQDANIGKIIAEQLFK